MDATGRPYALLMQKDSVAAYALEPRPAVSALRRAGTAAAVTVRGVASDSRPSRQEALQQVRGSTRRALRRSCWPSTGFCGRELYALDDRPNQLYMVGSMGCVVPLALGLALARPELRVLALDGDGAALDAHGSVRDRRCVRAAESAAPAVGQCRSRIDRRPSDGVSGASRSRVWPQPADMRLR